MKPILLLALLGCLPFCCFAQPKIEVGLTTEGSWIMKRELTMNNSQYGKKQNWGTALGAYIAMPVWWHFSVSGGIICRYSEIQKGTPIWTKEEGEEWSQISGCNFQKFQRYYLVIPLSLRLLVTRNCFISGGLEYCRFLNNYQVIQNNPEYNWTIGIGSQKHKLRWKLQYLRGFDKQWIQKYRSEDGHNVGFYFGYKTSRLQLSLSYPLWKN
jgi:hypothetical protein